MADIKTCTEPLRKMFKYNIKEDDVIVVSAQVVTMMLSVNLFVGAVIKSVK